MTQRTNEYGQPIGPAMPHWSPRPAPTGVTLKGRFCQLEPLNAARHAADLFAAYQAAPDGRNWTYLFSGPFANEDDYRRYAETAAQSTDPRHFAVIDTATGKPVGTLSLMRIDPTHGCIEVGNVTFSPLLQQTPASTEAQFLLMAYAFDTLGYRRYEWKCDSLNEPSRRAALRLGFQFEGIFRQALVYKGRSRDTAWYSITDTEWPAVRAALHTWLSEDNLDAQGQQRQSLAAIRTTQQGAD
jgi:RimJ/RimL family protein N-acetyltransferase